MEGQEIKLTLCGGKKPQDGFSINDKVYGERHFIREGDRYKEVTLPPLIPVRTLKDRSYTVTDSASFVSYVKRYGNPDEGIIFFNSTGVVMFFDEKNRVEKVSLPFAKSLELIAFLGNDNGKEFDQKRLAKTIETFPEVVADSDILLPCLTLLQMSKQVDFESNIDPHNHTFIYKDKSGDQTTRLPKQIVLNLPYFEGSVNKVNVLADFEVEMPTSAGAKPVFRLHNPRAERTEREAVEKEIETIKAELPGWMFVQGSAG
jgi:hypothetical protein